MSVNWKDVGKFVADAAPLIGGVLLGPAGAAAGSLISSTLGTGESPEAVLATLKADPAAMAKVLQIQSDERVRLEEIRANAANAQLEISSQFFKTEAEDRKNAREMSKESNNWVQPAISILLLGTIIGIIFLILSGKANAALSDGNTNLLIGSFLGYLFNELKTINGFWFGMGKSHSEQAAEFRFNINKDKK